MESMCSHLIGIENKQLSAIPMNLDPASFKSIENVEHAKISPGYPNPNYTKMARKRKDGVFLSQNGDAKAKFEATFPVEDVSGETFLATIRTGISWMPGGQSCQKTSCFVMTQSR